MSSWVAFDVETTGLSPTRHRIRQLAYVSFDLETIGFGTTIDLHPDLAIEASDGGMRWQLGRFLEITSKTQCLFAHNAAFDLAFVSEMLRRLRIRSFDLRAYCTLRLSRDLLPDLPSYDLATLRSECSLDHEAAHVAVNDARTVARLVQVLAKNCGISTESEVRTAHGPALSVRYGGLVAGEET